jgi:hypothetical protein
MEFHFLWWYKVPILLFMGPKQYLKLCNCQIIWTSLSVVFYVLQHKVMVKQGSCAFLNVTDILEVAEGNRNSFRNHLTAILPLLVFWYCYFLYVVVWLIYMTFVQLLWHTWSCHVSLLFVARGSVCVSDDQLLLVYSTYIFLMGNFVSCVTF